MGIRESIEGINRNTVAKDNGVKRDDASYARFAELILNQREAMLDNTSAIDEKTSDSTSNILSWIDTWDAVQNSDLKARIEQINAKLQTKDIEQSQMEHGRVM